MADEATEQATTTATPPEGAPEEVRRHLALALDVDDLIPALRLARDLSPWFGTMKVGLELYSAAGPEAITTLVDLGVDVFCDLKLHDIPNTVGRAARVVGCAGRPLPHAAHRRRARDGAGRRRGVARGRRGRRGDRARGPRRHGAHQRAGRDEPPRAAAGDGRARRRMPGLRLRGVATSPPSASSPPARSSSPPASGPRGRPRTIRHGSPHPARRSTPGPVSSSSDGP